MALEVKFIFDVIKIHLQVFIDQIFRIFDKDGGGTIDFRVWEKNTVFMDLSIDGLIINAKIHKNCAFFLFLF